MNMKFRELQDQNNKGISILYIDRDSEGDDVFEENHILWAPSDKGLALAEESPLVIESTKVVMIDSGKDLLGFYFLKEKKGEHWVLEPYYTPTFGDFFPPAPKRPRSKGHGSSFDKEQFDTYLKNLKEFLV